jgi:hypothetical protein
LLRPTCAFTLFWLLVQLLQWFALIPPSIAAPVRMSCTLGFAIETGFPNSSSVFAGLSWFIAPSVRRRELDTETESARLGALARRFRPSSWFPPGS